MQEIMYISCDQCRAMGLSVCSQLLYTSCLAHYVVYCFASQCSHGNISVDAAQKLIRNVQYEIPALKRQITKCQQQCQVAMCVCDNVCIYVCVFVTMCVYVCVHVVSIKCALQ